MRNLNNVYVAMLGNGESEHELKGDLYEILAQANDRLKISIVMYRVI